MPDVQALDNRIAQLEGIVRAQKENLKHWRSESDRDNGIIARLRTELHRRKHQPFEYDPSEQTMEDRVASWVISRIGQEHMKSSERAVRLLEEAVELCQSEGIQLALIQRQAEIRVL